MKKLYKPSLILFLFSILLIPSLNGQTLVHLDKPYYVSGETVWFKSYFDPTVQEGGIVSVKVVNGDQKMIHQSFLTISERSAKGYFKIPFDIQSGNYTLVLDGKTSVANDVRIAEVELPIYNDIVVEDFEKTETTSSYAGDINSTNLNINVTLSGKASSGDNVSAKIQVTDSNGNAVEADCSVSIVDQEMIGFNEGVGIMVTDQSDPYNDLTPELFYEGILYDNDGKAIQANVLGAYSYFDNNFSFTKSAADGKFTLPKNTFQGEKEIQFVGFQSEHPVVMAKLDQSVTLKSTPKDLRYTDDIQSYIEESRIRKKINQYFKLKDKASITSDIREEGVFPEMQAKYEVTEYQDFEIMAEFAKNLMMPLRFNGKKGERSAQVINPKSRKQANYFLKGDPLFIIDGKLTRNADYAGNLAQTEVLDLGIIYDGKKLREQFNVMGNSGVVVMNTSGRREKLPAEDERNIFRINGLQYDVNYPVGYNISSEIEGQPVFDPQLYWNPDVSTDSSGSATISYVQSNDRSTYRIVVVARTKDGNIGVGYLDFDSSLAGE